MCDFMHVKWGMNMCQCVLCILNSLSCLLGQYIFLLPSAVSQVHMHLGFTYCRSAATTNLRNVPSCMCQRALTHPKGMARVTALPNALIRQHAGHRDCGGGAQ